MFTKKSKLNVSSCEQDWIGKTSLFNWSFINIQNKWSLEKETDSLDLELQAFMIHEMLL